MENMFPCADTVYSCIRKEQRFVFSSYIDTIGKTNHGISFANNRWDNMISFHDVMQTYRWELRCLSFFLAVAFSACKIFAHDGKDMLHSKFRCTLGLSLLAYSKPLRENRENQKQPPPTRSQTAYAGHKRINMGVTEKGWPRKRVCHVQTCQYKSSLRCYAIRIVSSVIVICTTIYPETALKIYIRNTVLISSFRHFIFEAC